MVSQEQIDFMKKVMPNGSQELVAGMEIGDEFINTQTGQIHTCDKIEWIEDRYFYGYGLNDPWMDGQVSWVAARHVKPYTVMNIILDEG